MAGQTPRGIRRIEAADPYQLTGASSTGDLAAMADEIDAAISEAVMELEGREGGIDGQPTVLNSTHNLDTQLTTGDYAVWSGSNAPTSWPEPAPGHLRVQQVGTLVYQTVRTLSGVYRRTRSVSWFPWVKSASVDDIPEPTQGGRSSSPRALREAMLRLSNSAGTNTQTDVSAVLRFPVHLAPRVSRWRLLVRNGNDRTEQTGAAVSITGVWVGEGWNGTFSSSPTRTSNAFTVGAGTTKTTPWYSARLGDGKQMMLSIGFTATGTVHRSTGGGWLTTSAATGAGDAAAPSGMTRVGTVPLLWWLEVEVDADTPVVMGWGDSITTGTGNTLPINDAPLAQWARSRGAIPVLAGGPGTGMVEWEDDADAWWGVFSTQRPDAVVHWMGQNDLSDGQTLAEMQRRYNATIGSLTAYGVPVMLGAITPTANKLAATNTTRVAYNDWLATLPDPDNTGLVRDFYDLSAAVSSNGTSLNSGLDSGDGLHLNTAGSAAVAAVLGSRRLASRGVGSTGWVTIDITNTGGSIRDAATPGTLHLRRDGDRVTARVQGVGLTTGSGPGFLLPNDIPAGFQAMDVTGPAVAADLGSNGNVANRHRVHVSTNDVYWCGWSSSTGAYSTTRAAGTVLQGEMTWTTDDDWPA